MEIREMAEAHLKNVQQQVQELQEQRGRIDADIQTLNEYLQQGVSELNAAASSQQQTAPNTGQVEVPSLSLPPTAN